MKTALLISTYNWSQSLRLVLKSLTIQTKFPDEILIADDGSTEVTQLLIDSFRSQIDIPIIHVWQEDIGFRKSQILNKAIAKTNADYIIQIDGDCIMHRKFIEDHIKFAEKGVYLHGSRVNILPDYVGLVIDEEILSFNCFSKCIRNRTRALHIPLFTKLYKPQDFHSRKYRGCNTSFWKNDFIAVNGYDEDITGWGREDSELAIRLNNNGVKSKRIRYSGIVYHLYHKGYSKSNLERNTQKQNESLNNKIKYCENGIDKYLKN